jgi:hypothetical protein
MTPEERKKYDDSEKVIHEIAWIAWKGAANAYRMYPDNSHTFSGYWDGAKDQFQKYIDAHNLQQEKIAALESRNEELVKALGNCLQILEQTREHRKYAGHTGGNIFLNSSIEEIEKLLLNHEGTNKQNEG